jgi:hypothetical protein
VGAAADRGHGHPAERSSRQRSAEVRRIADPGSTDPAGAERRVARAVARRRARAGARHAGEVAVAAAAARTAAAAVLGSRRMGSGPRAIRTEKVRLVRGPDLEVQSPLAADPAAAEHPTPAAVEAVAAAVPVGRVPAARREMLPAGRDAGALHQVPAVPKRERAARHTHPAEAADLRGPLAPAGWELRRKGRTCWWAGSELHSERRRSLRETPDRENAPTEWRGEPAQHSRPFLTLEQEPHENPHFSRGEGLIYASFSSWTRAALPSRSRR